MNKKLEMYMGVIIMPYLNNHFHVYDQHKDLSFQIVGKSKFIYWLNDHADQERYSFFTTYSKLKKYIGV